MLFLPEREPAVSAFQVRDVLDPILNPVEGSYNMEIRVLEDAVREVIDQNSIPRSVLPHFLVASV